MSLDAYVSQLARAEGPESLEERGDQRRERLDPICWRDENDHGNGERAEILLVSEILISGHQGVEVRGGQLKQFTVSLASPPHLSDCPDLVAKQQASQRSRQRFIEQKAHRLSANLWRAQEPQLPVPASRWEVIEELI